MIALPSTAYGAFSDGSEPLYTAEQMQDYANSVAEEQRGPLLNALVCCKNWFERFSPNADLINGGVAEHPMLTCINAALAADVVAASHSLPHVE